MTQLKDVALGAAEIAKRKAESDGALIFVKRGGEGIKHFVGSSFIAESGACVLGISIGPIG